jgi:hypothetical protein
MLNLFNELDLNSLPEAVRVSKIHNLLSELYLVGSKDLVDLLGDYKETLFEFHNELEEVVKNGKKDEAKCKQLHKLLANKTAELSIQMRKDLFIDTNTEDPDHVSKEMGF